VHPFVCVGLGNPGINYASTRHNLGFMVVEELARQLGMTFRESKPFQAALAKGNWPEAPHRGIHLLLPLTYMNESGRAVRKYVDYLKMEPSQVVVVSDDAALKLGGLRLREGGSSGGHNGLKSLSLHLGTEDYVRLKMGIGSNAEHESLADYVLSDFTQEETPQIEEAIKRGVKVLKMLITEPLIKVMSQYTEMH